MEKKINNKKIRKFVGAGFFTLSLVMGINVYEAKVDHLTEYCKLNDVLGIEHQIDKVNNESLSTRAMYLENGIMHIEHQAEKLNFEGGSIYVAPSGFVRQDDIVYKDIKYAEDDAILITKNKVIIPTNDGLVKTSYEDYDVISVINIPTKTR